MRSFIVFALALLLLVALAFGKNNQCKIDGHSFKVGEKYRPLGKCVEWSCDAPGQMHALSCTPYASRKKCRYTPKDLTQEYPNCCPKFEC